MRLERKWRLQRCDASRGDLRESWWHGEHICTQCGPFRDLAQTYSHTCMNIQIYLYTESICSISSLSSKSLKEEGVPASELHKVSGKSGRLAFDQVLRWQGHQVGTCTAIPPHVHNWALTTTTMRCIGSRLDHHQDMLRRFARVQSALPAARLPLACPRSPFQVRAHCTGVCVTSSDSSDIFRSLFWIFLFAVFLQSSCSVTAGVGCVIFHDVLCILRTLCAATSLPLGACLFGSSWA